MSSCRKYRYLHITLTKRPYEQNEIERTLFEQMSSPVRCYAPAKGNVPLSQKYHFYILTLFYPMEYGNEIAQ